MVIAALILMTFFMWLAGPEAEIGFVILLGIAAMVSVVATGFSRRFAIFSAMASAGIATAASLSALIGLGATVRLFIIGPADILGFLTSVFLAGLSLAAWSMTHQITRGFSQGWHTPIWGSRPGQADNVRTLEVVRGR